MPRKLVNHDLSEELASFMEDYFVPHTTMAVAKLLRMTASHNRGTVNWLNAVESVGLLLALATDEQKQAIRLALTSSPTKVNAKAAIEAAGFTSGEDIFK